MVCHQQSRATSPEHHSERHSYKAGYLRRALLLIGTFILAVTSGYAHSADQSSLGRRKLMEKVDASNVFLRKGSNSHTVDTKRTSKSKLHTADPTRTQREKAVKGAKSRKWIPKSIPSTYFFTAKPVTQGALFLSLCSPLANPCFSNRDYSTLYLDLTFPKTPPLKNPNQSTML
jgi:hypothetical protein